MTVSASLREILETWHAAYADPAQRQRPDQLRLGAIMVVDGLLGDVGAPRDFLHGCGNPALTQHIDGHAEVVGAFGHHPVKPVPGTRYAEIAPEETSVPTYHHQALALLAPGLTPSAYAPDGTVEAVETPLTDGWVLGVQWHPEMGDDLRVMRALVRAAS